MLNAVMRRKMIRSPEFTIFHRSSERIWFLLHWGWFHVSRQTHASAVLSTGVLAVRGTPGQLYARDS
jgi:hypothetical protein